LRVGARSTMVATWFMATWLLACDGAITQATY
jgi:hypothetical protein